jgi:quercetin dioxygenase-like cupin family protein
MTLQSTPPAIDAVTFRGESAPVLRVVGERVTPVLDGAIGATAYEVFDATGPEGSGPPPHSHPWDEGYVVIEGQLAVVDWSSSLEEPTEEVLNPGGSAFVPSGTTHSFQVRSDRCRFFIVTTPGAHAFFSDAEKTVGDNIEDLDTLISVAKRNGLSSPLF